MVATYHLKPAQRKTAESEKVIHYRRKVAHSFSSRRRQTNLEKGKALLKEGKRSEAVDCFQKSVDVSPEMAHALIKVGREKWGGVVISLCVSHQECRSAGVEYIVAPYEADSQLAYLSKEGIVDLIITEDSDLLVFGCRKVGLYW